MQVQQVNMKEEVTNLKQICERNNIMTWWNWWKARHFRIVPAFRGFCVSGMNMAESRQSAMKTR